MNTLHSFQARYTGVCPDCDNAIRLGDDVHFNGDDQVVHDTCPDQLDDSHGTPCRDCFLIHAGKCP